MQLCVVLLWGAEAALRWWHASMRAGGWRTRPLGVEVEGAQLLPPLQRLCRLIDLLGRILLTDSAKSQYQPHHNHGSIAA